MTGTNNRVHVSVIKNTSLQTLLSLHGYSEPWCFPKPTKRRHVSVQWDRAIRSSAPVRGSTRPSIPPSLSRLEGVYPKAESPKVIYFLFFPVNRRRCNLTTDHFRRLAVEGHGVLQIQVNLSTIFGSTRVLVSHSDGTIEKRSPKELEKDQ